MMKKVLTILMAIAVLLTTSCAVLSPKEHNEENTETFLFPGEEQMHEGTWLTWPHKYAYKQTYCPSTAT